MRVNMGFHAIVTGIDTVFKVDDCQDRRLNTYTVNLMIRDALLYFSHTNPPLNPFLLYFSQLREGLQLVWLFDRMMSI